MKIVTIGTGYVGLVTAACLAELGHEVLGLDIDTKKIEVLKSGEIPIYEPGLNELVKKNLKEKRLSFTDKFTNELDGADIIFLAVGTPSKEDGTADLTYIYKAIDSVIANVKSYTIFVLKSTVPIGTNQEINKYIASRLKTPFDVVSNPEFLKEGTAVQDFMKPDRIVIGTENIKASEIMKELYSQLTRNGHPIYVMDPISAETVKYACNLMLALKISYINEMAQICDVIGADIRRVREGIISDTRIGKHFFYPSIGFGGSCFPKDVLALEQFTKSKGIPCVIPAITLEINERQAKWFIDKVVSFFGKDKIKNKTLTIWGTAFKAGTDDIRESPALKIVSGLLEAGATLKIYDPIALENTKTYLKDAKGKFEYANSDMEAITNSDGLVVCTEWLQFRSPDFEKLASNLKDKVIFDGRNLYDPEKLKLYGLKHIGIGISSEKTNQQSVNQQSAS
jgi:UDPglucose 6-dehydrogenase